MDFNSDCTIGLLGPTNGRVDALFIKIGSVVSEIQR